MSRFIAFSIWISLSVASCAPKNSVPHTSPLPITDNAIMVSPENASPFTGSDWAPGSDRLVVYSTFDYAHIIDLDSNRVIPLQNSSWAAASIAWDPTGNQLVFWSNSIGPPGIWVLDVGKPDSAPFYVATGHSVDWSPIGDQLVIGVTTESEPRNSELFIQNISDSGQRKLFESRGFFSGFSDLEWSPNGRYIAFVFTYNQSADINSQSITELYVSDLQNGEVLLLSEGPIIGQSISWSPDSSKVLYVSDEQLRSMTFIVQHLDGDCHQVVADMNLSRNPKLSPDGSLMAFERGEGQIYVAASHQLLGDDYWNDGAACN